MAREIRHEEFQTMTDVFLGENFDRRKLEQVESLQMALHEQQAVLSQRYEVKELGPEEYVEAFNTLLDETFVKCEDILGRENFLQLFGAPRSELAGFIDKETFLRAHHVTIQNQGGASITVSTTFGPAELTHYSGVGNQMEEKQLNGDSILNTPACEKASENVDSTNSLTVGIIGVAGRYGQWLKPRFASLGHHVIGSDLGTSPSNAEVVARSNVVVFSVPIADTVNIIEDVIEHSRSDQLWMDITSVKEAPIAAMLKSKADVIGLHPMCGPDLRSWEGQTVAVCYARVKNETWKDFLQRFLTHTQADFYVIEPPEHDANMAYVQALPHALSMMMVGAFTCLGKDGINVSETRRYATPPYNLAFAAVSRILDSNPDLYADIQISNKKHTLSILRELQTQASYLYDCVEGNNKEGIKQLLKKGRDHFKQKNVADGLYKFLQLFRLMADFSAKNSKIIHCTDDYPGLLDIILQVIKEHNINLTSLHSFKDPEYKGFSFHLGFPNDCDSWSVQKAMCDIRNNQNLQDIVVIEDPPVT